MTQAHEFFYRCPWCSRMAPKALAAAGAWAPQPPQAIIKGDLRRLRHAPQQKRRSLGTLPPNSVPLRPHVYLPVTESDAGGDMDRKKVIHSDPEILGGKPVFVGTRVPVKSLYDYLEGGDSLDEFLDNFPSVSREQAIAALELGRMMAEANAPAS